MVELLYQNDPRWKGIRILNTECTIGSHGCLISASANAKNIHENEIVETPETLYKKLVINNGLTDNGLIIWNELAKILNCKIEHNYKGTIKYDINSYYVVHYYMLDNKGKRHGHFTNLIDEDQDQYNFFVFDVWDKLNKIKKGGEIDRYVKYIF